MADTHRFHIIVQGRVQGVGFRYFTLEAANTLFITGWVRNRWDDSVEILAEGEAQNLALFVERVRKGPRSAYVSHLEIDQQTATGEFTSFVVKEMY